MSSARIGPYPLSIIGSIGLALTIALAVSIGDPAVAQPPPSEPSLASDPIFLRLVEPSGAEPLFGPVALRFEVPEGVTRLEIWLDGTPVASLEGPPWEAEVDFGEDNTPHRLEVRALGGNEASDPIDELTVEVPAFAVDEAVDLDLQQLYVTVTNRRGKRVRDLDALGLRATDFTVEEAGVRQELVTFAAGDVPFTAALLVDSSASMLDGRLEAAIRGVERFVEGMGEFDLARLLLFADRLLALSPWSEESEQLTAQLRERSPAGGSAVLDHLHLSLLLLRERQGRRVVVLLSDGWDMHSVLETAQVERLARETGAQIHWIRPAADVPKGRKQLAGSSATGLSRSIPYSTWRDRDQALDEYRRLETLVEDTGGRVRSYDRDSEIEQQLVDVIEELRSQVALGYYPEGRRGDGSWRPVEIEIDGGRRLRGPRGVVDLAPDDRP